jgi:hypothetical protein
MFGEQGRRFPVEKIALGPLPAYTRLKVTLGHFVT